MCIGRHGGCYWLWLWRPPSCGRYWSSGGALAFDLTPCMPCSFGSLRCPRSETCAQHGGSRVGARYRHTTVDMAARMVDAIEARLAIVLRAAEDQASLDQGTVRVARL